MPPFFPFTNGRDIGRPLALSDLRAVLGAVPGVLVGADVDSGPALLADGLLVVGADDGALHAIGDAAPVAP